MSESVLPMFSSRSFIVSGLLKIVSSMRQSYRVIQWGSNFTVGLPQWLSGKEFAYNAGDVSLIPGSEDLIEKEMATHSSILAWEILWIEEPGRLQSKRLQRIGHNLATKHTYTQVYLFGVSTHLYIMTQPKTLLLLLSLVEDYLQVYGNAHVYIQFRITEK